MLEYLLIERVTRYQVRFALLQAAHYGTPQTRVRFFCIAAKIGCPLPEFPAPLYTSPVNDSLELSFEHGLRLRPINVREGTAPFCAITVDDAIGDLALFDWCVYNLSLIFQNL